MVITIILLAFVLTSVVVFGYAFKWDWTGFHDKLFYDWLGLLIIPAVLGFGAYLFNRSERRNELQISQDRAHEDTFQRYLDSMQNLIVDQKLLESEALNTSVQAVARTRTLAALRSLDGTRKGLLLTFLYDQDLIKNHKTIISMAKADMSNIRLEDVDLSGANLEGAILTNALLRGVNLSYANLSDSDITGSKFEDVDLTGAVLHQSVMERANLYGAILRRADLLGANLRTTNLQRADLTGTILEGGRDLRKPSRLNPIELTVPRLHRENIHAITLWPFILYRRGLQDDIALRCHEYFHWRQALRWGVIPWYLTYLALLPFYFQRPADQHPLEAPAYALQRQVLRLLSAGESIDEYLDELGVTLRA